VSTEQRERLDAILRQSAFPVGNDAIEQRRLLRELLSAQPLPAGVTVTAAALGGVPAAEITVEGVEPRHVVLYFHGGVYVMGDAFLAAGLASQVGRRTRAKVISVDYRLAPEQPVPGRGRRRSRGLRSPSAGRRGPVGHGLRGGVRRRWPRHRHLGQRPRSQAAPARRGLRHVTVCRFCIELSIQGTFLGPFQTPAGPIQPTGAKIDFPTADFWYLRHGKVEVFDCHIAFTTMYEQLGVLPDFASAAAAPAP